MERKYNVGFFLVQRIPTSCFCGPYLEASLKVYLADEVMDIRVACRQEQEGEPLLSSLSATGHICQ